MRSDERLVIPFWVKALGGVGVIVIAAAIAFAVFEPIQVLPRMRLAPGYAFTAQDGSTFTSESVRGSVTLYTFAPLDCDDCDELDETMRTVASRVASEIDLDDASFRLATVVLDPDADLDEVGLAAERAGADPSSWVFLSGDETMLRTVVGSGFQRYYEPNGDDIRYDPGFVLTDGNGIVRGDYRYSTLADDSDKLVRHIGILASEIRNSNGPTSVAYEAAHLFLCYP